MITIEEMRRLEEDADMQGLSPEILMEHAGKNCAEVLADSYDLSALTPLFFCGLGNNAGDGFVMARHIAKDRFVFVLLVGNEDDLSPVAAANFIRIRDNEMIEIMETSNPSIVLEKVERIVKKMGADTLLFIDALLGIGAKGPLKEPIKSAVKVFNAFEAKKVAIDVPTGFDLSSHKPPKLHTSFDTLLTLHAIKKGLEQFKDKTVVVDIGLN